jgi:hypothetical protein
MRSFLLPTGEHRPQRWAGMAEHTARTAEGGAVRQDSAGAVGDARHEAMERREASPETRYGALLNRRPPGPRPSQPARVPNDTGLPDRLKSGVEALSGVSLDGVKVHYNSSRPAQLNALAYAQGSDIHVAPGQEGHLPHEAWHVVQQRQGRVSPTLRMKGVEINDESGLEREADAMGAAAARMEATDADLAACHVEPAGAAPVQGKFVYDNGKVMSSLAYDKMKLALDDDPTLVNFINNGDPASSVANDFEAWLARESANMSAIGVAEHVTAIFVVDKERPEEAVDPLAKVMAAEPLAQFKIPIGNSRAKIVYLFDAAGEPTTKKVEGRYMIDTEMDRAEYDHLKTVESYGLRIPTIYGKHKLGPVVQWLGNQATVGGGGAKPLVPIARQMMQLDQMTGKGFAAIRWQQTLRDIDRLIAVKFASDDLQFMIDNATGRIYLMDFDAANVPRIGAAADERLTNLKAFLEAAIEKGGLPANTGPPQGLGGLGGFRPIGGPGGFRRTGGSGKESPLPGGNTQESKK